MQIGSVTCFNVGIDSFTSKGQGDTHFLDITSLPCGFEDVERTELGKVVTQVTTS